MVAKLVWRVKLVAELRPGVTEAEVARIEGGGQAGMADLGLRLTETKPSGCGFLKAVEFGCKLPWFWDFCRRHRIG